MLAAAQRMALECDRLRQNLTDRGDDFSGMLRNGVLGSVIPLLKTFTIPFRRRYPDVNLRVTILNAFGVQQAFDDKRQTDKADRQWIAETRNRLAQRRGKRPATKAGQSRALWPEIRAAKAEGQSLATICQWLEEEAGIVVTVQSLGSYLTRIQRKEPATPTAPTPQPVRVLSKSPVSTARTKFSVNAKKNRGFEYPPGPPDESKLIRVRTDRKILPSRTPLPLPL